MHDGVSLPSLKLSRTVASLVINFPVLEEAATKQEPSEDPQAVPSKVFASLIVALTTGVAMGHIEVRCDQLVSQNQRCVSPAGRCF